MSNERVLVQESQLIQIYRVRSFLFETKQATHETDLRDQSKTQLLWIAVCSTSTNHYIPIFGRRVWTVTNLFIPIYRAHRVGLGTGLEHLEHVPKRILAGFSREVGPFPGVFWEIFTNASSYGKSEVTVR
jgi:hypothetical protein